MLKLKYIESWIKSGSATTHWSYESSGFEYTPALCKDGNVTFQNVKLTSFNNDCASRNVQSSLMTVQEEERLKTPGLIMIDMNYFYVKILIPSLV